MVMNIYTFDAKKRQSIYVIFGVISIFLFAISLNAPPLLIKTERTVKAKDYHIFTYEETIENMEKLNKEITGKLVFNYVLADKDMTKGNVIVRVTVQQLDHKTNKWTVLYDTPPVEVPLICYNRTGYCDPINFLHIPSVMSSSYKYSLEVYYDGDEKFYDDATLFIEYHNRDFSMFDIYVHYVFLTLALVATYYFLTVMEGVEWRNGYTFEQKWIFFFLISLILFDNPIFTLVFIDGSVFTRSLNAFFSSIILWLLDLFAHAVLDSYRVPKEERTIKKFWGYRIIFFSGMFCLYSLLLIWGEIFEKQGTEYSSVMYVPEFVFAFIVFVLYVFIYGTWISLIIFGGFQIKDKKRFTLFQYLLIILGIFSLMMFLDLIVTVATHGNIAGFLSWFVMMVNTFVFLLMYSYMDSSAKPFVAREETEGTKINPEQGALISEVSSTDSEESDGIVDDDESDGIIDDDEEK